MSPPGAGDVQKNETDTEFVFKELTVHSGVGEGKRQTYFTKDV